MKVQKTIVRVICVVLAALMILSVLMAAIQARAISQSDIQMIQEKRRSLEEQLAEQAVLIQSLTENHALIIDRKAALDRQIELNRMNIDLMEEQIRIYDELIMEKQQELDSAIIAENTQSDLLRNRMRAMEESGNYSYISFLFASTSFTDLLSRIADINDIMHYDKQLEEDYRAAREKVQVIKAEYEQAQLDQSVICDELDTRKQQLSAQIDAACSLIANLNEQSEDAQREYAAIAQAEEAAYAEEQRAVAEYAEQLYQAQLAAQRAAAAQAAAAQAAAQQAAAQAGGGDTYSQTYAAAASVSNGGFIWPVDSTYITSGYGARSAPTAGASTYHQAIDIGAAAGSPIYAVADGQVAVATYNNGLGNYVSIVHDGDTSTRYSHMTNFIVQPGETVTQGQIIGYVGATGIATGNHLDFAVIQNGQQVNPLDYYDTSGLTFDPTA